MRKVLTLTLLASLITFGGCKAIFHPGFYDKEEYLRYEKIPTKHCGELEICFTQKETTAWNRDSSGVLGDRRKLFVRNAEHFKHGGLNGLSYECLVGLLGESSDKYPSPKTDSSFTYNISQNHDSTIQLHLWYNRYFDKVISSTIIISIKKLPTNPAWDKCGIQFYAKIDTMLRSGYYQREGIFIVVPRQYDERSKLSYLMRRGISLTDEFNNQPIECFECYFGKADSYTYAYGVGMEGDYSEFLFANFRSKTIYFTYKIYFSEETGRIQLINQTRKITGCG